MSFFFYKNFFTVHLIYSPENIYFQKISCISEYNWLLHHNFHVFITLWSVSAPVLRHMLPFPFLFILSFFFFSWQLGKEGHAASSFRFASTGEWKKLLLPYCLERQSIGSLNGVRECILLTVEISNLKRRILNSWYHVSSQTLRKSGFISFENFQLSLAILMWNILNLACKSPWAISELFFPSPVVW